MKPPGTPALELPAAIPISGNAPADVSEVAQLRREVAELKAMIQQRPPEGDLRATVDLLTQQLADNNPAEVARRANDRKAARLAAMDAAQVAAEANLAAGEKQYLVWLRSNSGGQARVVGCGVAENELHAAAKYLKHFGITAILDPKVRVESELLTPAQAEIETQALNLASPVDRVRRGSTLPGVSVSAPSHYVAG